MPRAMKRGASPRIIFRIRGAWAALALVPLLSGCLAAVAIPLVAGGGLSVVTKHRVRAATAAPAAGAKPKHATSGTRKTAVANSAETGTLTALKALPPPGGAAPVAADDPWQKFFAYALEQRQADGQEKALHSAVLKPNPSLDAPERRNCSTPYLAVVIDLDDVSAPFAPERLMVAPSGVADGLARLRGQGIVVLWISQLPASRAADVARALQASGLDPKGQDQLLLIRNGQDRKQVLRDNASDDVCIVAIAGDKRGDFDELFDYLRNPESAVGLYPMLGRGWFLVPPLDGSAPGEQ